MSEKEQADHELLMTIIEEQRSSSKHRKMIAYAEIAILVFLVLFFLLVVPKLISVLNDMTDALNRVNTVLESVEPAVSDLSTMVDQTAPAVESLSKIDYDGLSEAITKLTEVVNSLSRLTSWIP